MPSTPQSGLRYPSLSDDPNVPEDIQNLATDLDSRIIPRFTSTATRDSAITSPTEGQVCYVTGSDVLQYYSGSAWRGLGTQLIAENILTGTAATVTFSGLPTYFNSLRVLILARGDTASTLTASRMRFNGDSTAVYDVEQILANGATVAAAEGLNGTFAEVGEIAAASAVAGSAAMMEIVIPFYRGTTFWKPFISHHMLQAQASGGAANSIYTKQWVGRWRNTGAITSIEFSLAAGNYIAGSSFALYGMT